MVNVLHGEGDTRLVLVWCVALCDLVMCVLVRVLLAGHVMVV